MKVLLKVILPIQILNFFLNAENEVVNYVNGMWTEPKYFAVRMFFQLLIPDMSVGIMGVLALFGRKW